MEEQVINAPTCIKCEARPLPITMHIVNAPNGLVLGIVCCANCGTVIPFIPFGAVQQPTLAITPTEASRFKH